MSETTPTDAPTVRTINVLAPEIRADPYPSYSELRRSGPRQVDPGGIWAIARYNDVQYVLKNPNLFASSAFRGMLEPDWIPRNPMAHSMLCLDPPEHTKRRALVTRGFTSAAIAGMRPFIESVASEIVDSLGQSSDHVDFVAEMSSVLPARVIAELIGLDPELHKSFHRLGTALASITPAPPTEEQIATVVPCLEEMQSYLREVVQARRKKPTSDMVSSLIAAKIDGEGLTDDELLNFLFILIPAGVETTSHLLSNAALYLARRPDDFESLRANPGLIPAYVDELLRYEPPIHGLLRLCMDDVELGGTAIARGSLILALLGSANRDGEIISDPDRFDPGRSSSAHFGFGHGVHACLGAALARVEGKIALTELCRRFVRLELQPDTELSWNVSLTIRGLNELYVRCVPG